MKHDLDYMIAVMQAAKERKQIEEKDLYDDNAEWIDCNNNPAWDWSCCDYRVKPKEPKKKYVPYESAEEFLQAQKEHGIYILTPINGSHYELPFIIDNESIYFYGCIVRASGIIESIKYPFSKVLKEYIWQDGTPCGKLKKE